MKKPNLNYISLNFLALLTVISFLFGCNSNTRQSQKSINGSWTNLIEKTDQIGKKEWRPMLKYVAELHQKSTHPAEPPFDYDWEEIGPGYVYSRAFGHWDVVHQIVDVMADYPEHSLHQLLNNIKNQESNGFIPGSIWLPGGNIDREKAYWHGSTHSGHPPVWVIGVQDYYDLTRNDSILKQFYPALLRQITWFENERKAEGEGFFYNDILNRNWESGVDEGIRFDIAQKGRLACVDATSHVYSLYKYATKWSKILGFDQRHVNTRQAQLKHFIQDSLYSNKDHMFYDIWAIKDASLKNLAFENLWPVIVGVATQEQAENVIDDYILNEKHFLSKHPLTTVSQASPKFELRMWRGPAWNSMTYWVARGCLQYGREDAAKVLLERALDQSAKVFDETGNIWEFYHPNGGSPTEVKRKPHTKYNQPSKDYLGHNPLLAMARMYDQIQSLKK